MKIEQQFISFYGKKCSIGRPNTFMPMSKANIFMPILLVYLKTQSNNM